GPTAARLLSGIDRSDGGRPARQPRGPGRSGSGLAAAFGRPGAASSAGPRRQGGGPTALQCRPDGPGNGRCLSDVSMTTPVFRTTRRIEFADTDMAGIVHFANFFRFMEVAEVEFLRSRGLSVMATIEDRTISFPRVAASCDFLRPVRF